MFTDLYICVINKNTSHCENLLFVLIKEMINKFFDKIFIINLEDNKTRYEKVARQFKSRKIATERFLAIDGRCKQDKSRTKQLCLDKLENFKIKYNIDYKLSASSKKKLSQLVPASSLTLGTILILRRMIKEKWKRILICEDDIELTKNFVSEFNKGIKELGNKRWDLLYLGVGGEAGLSGVSWDKDSVHKYASPWDESGDYGFVSNKNDLRTPIDEDNDEVKAISDRLSKVTYPGGNWCYAYSLAGAKKILKIIDNNILEHIDQIIMKNGHDIRSIAFDPPIVYHENIRGQRNTDIPW